MNLRRVPQLHVATGATKWNDPKNFPWTMGWQPRLPDRSADLRPTHPEDPARREDRRLYQNDDYARTT